MNDYLHVSVAEDRLGLKYPVISIGFMQTFAIDHSLNFKLPSSEVALEKEAASVRFQKYIVWKIDFFMHLPRDLQKECASLSGLYARLHRPCIPEGIVPCAS